MDKEISNDDLDLVLASDGLWYASIHSIVNFILVHFKIFISNKGCHDK